MLHRYAACWCTDDSHRAARRERLRLRRKRATIDLRRAHPLTPGLHMAVRLPGGQIVSEDEL